MKIVLEQIENSHSVKVKFFGIDPNAQIYGSHFKMTEYKNGIQGADWRDKFDIKVTRDQVKDDQYLLKSLLPRLLS